MTSNLEAVKKYRTAHPERVLESSRKTYWRNTLKPYLRQVNRRTGLEVDQYFEILTKQNNCCAICGKPSDQRLDVDHDHKNGRIRGLLCRSCNIAIGKMEDNPERLRRAADYLEQKDFNEDYVRLDQPSSDPAISDNGSGVH